VAPFAGYAIGSVDDSPVHDQAAADSRPQDHAEDDGRSLTRAIDRLGKGKAIGVVGNANLALQTCAQVAEQVAPVEAGRIGVLHRARVARDRAGCAQAKVRERSEFTLGGSHELFDRIQRLLIVALRSRDSVPIDEAPVLAQNRDFDFRAPKVYADAIHMQKTNIDRKLNAISVFRSHS